MKSAVHLNNADHHVYLSIREQIFDGRIPPNSFINIQSLATLHKVSVLPVREALIRLAAEDLVEHSRSRGFMSYIIRLNTLMDSYCIIYNMYQLNLRLNISTKPMEYHIDDGPLHNIQEGVDLTAKFVDDTLEIFASRLMREHFYACFLRELRRTRPFRYQTFHLRNDVHKIAEYIYAMKKLTVNREYKEIYRINRAFQKYNMQNLKDIYHIFVENNQKNQVYNSII